MSYEPFSVYSTWGFHDELGDTVNLTEALCMTALDTLAQWQQEDRFHVDYFHMDCFWFDKEKPYTGFNPRFFPNGHGAIFERVRSLGMKPGLWYSVNGHHMNPREWADSKVPGEAFHSLLDGSYADSFEEALIMAARDWGVRFFKFDFATFRATLKTDRPAREHYAQGVARFKRMLRRLRQEYPDVHILTHCGFARTEQSTVSGTPVALATDLSWLEVVDAMFPGDPHPIDIPQTALERNIDVYQDRQTWALHQHGYPLHRMDDHGALMGTTNTACYRGRSGFKRTCLGQLSRGCRRHFFYGNPTLLSRSDRDFMGKARALFFDAFRRNLTTCFVGEGEPGLAPWHGFLTGGGDAGLLYLVNPGTVPVAAKVPVTSLDAARLLFHDGKKAPAVQTQPDLVTVLLAPEQLALVGIGDYAQAVHALPADDGPALPGDMALLPLTFTPATQPGVVEATLDTAARATLAGRKLYVVAQVFEEQESGVAAGLPHRFARQFSSGEAGSNVPECHAHDSLIIEALDAKGHPASETQRIPNVPIWAGISWVARKFEVSTLAPGPLTLRITQKLDPRKRLVTQAWSVEA